MSLSANLFRSKSCTLIALSTNCVRVGCEFRSVVVVMLGTTGSSARVFKLGEVTSVTSLQMPCSPSALRRPPAIPVWADRGPAVNHDVACAPDGAGDTASAARPHHRILRVADD